MTEFDISHLMFTYDSVPSLRYKNHGSFDQMIEWVETHIGAQTEKHGFTQEIMRRGIGWEIRTKKSDSEKLNKLTHRSFKVISWSMCIEDPELATLFALKWSK